MVEARAAVESLPAHLLDELEGAVRAHLSRGQAASGANPLSPRSPASSCRVAGSPPRSGRPTAALADVGEHNRVVCFSTDCCIASCYWATR